MGRNSMRNVCHDISVLYEWVCEFVCLYKQLCRGYYTVKEWLIELITKYSEKVVALSTK